MKNISSIRFDTIELDRFLQLKKRLNLSDSQVMKKLLDYFDSYQQDSKALQRQLETYKQRELKALTIGDAISDGIYVINSHGVVLEVNKRFCQLVAMEPDQLIGINIQELVDKGVLSNPVALSVLKQKLYYCRFHLESSLWLYW